MEQDQQDQTTDDAPVSPSWLAALIARSFSWLIDEAPWYVASFFGHLVVIAGVLLLASFLVQPIIRQDDAPQLDSSLSGLNEPIGPVAPFDIGNVPLDTTDLSTESLTAPDSLPMQTAQFNDDREQFVERGGGEVTGLTSPATGGAGFDVLLPGAGAALQGPGGVAGAGGTGKNPGAGGDGNGFGGRGAGSRKALVGTLGGTKQTERAVAAALNWLARHQMDNGSWSLGGYTAKCKANDKTCTGPGMFVSDPAATALGLLPFLAAGQTHQTRGPYQKHVRAGLVWLISAQGKDGYYGKGLFHPMYTHALATITLCEAYGLTHDKKIGVAAQAAIDFIQTAQNKSTGGWRYEPNTSHPGDTSVVGWQLMALKSAQMAGLKVNDESLQGAKKFLGSVQAGRYGEKFSYTPRGKVTLSMTAVGLLCSQYSHIRRDDPRMTGGVEILMANLPSYEAHDFYYWYYATQVLHNLPGPEWDTWNRRMRRTLIESQVRNGCAQGSWDPELPTRDPWGGAGGRLFMTSLATLTLEVYYRYLPLYKLDKPSATETAAATSKDDPPRRSTPPMVRERDAESTQESQRVVSPAESPAAMKLELPVVLGRPSEKKDG